MTTPAVPGQIDNLAIGLYLTKHRFGVELDSILQEMGWNPSATGDRDRFVRRFRHAQAIGRDARRDRRAGYFSWNAQPFGETFVYKVTWYVWRNPQTSVDQTVPMFISDLQGMRDFRDKYLDTLTSTTRGIRARHDLEALEDAESRGDRHDVRFVQSRMLKDGGLGEILSGYFGLPYADMEELISQLPSDMLNRTNFDLKRSVQKMERLQDELEKEKVKISDQVHKLALVRSGLPRNAYQLALRDAEDRLSSLRPTT